MKIFNREEFIKLSQKSAEPFISIYTPTTRVSTNAYKEDITHLKNQISSVEKKLETIYELSKADIDKILSPAKALLEDFDFWQHNSDMVAIFLSDGEMDVFEMPLELNDSFNFVGSKPMLLPMIPELNDDGHYYLLLLNLDKIRLYEATRNVIHEVKLDPELVATSFTAEEDEDENQDQLHGQGGSGNAGVMYHGHDGGSDEVKKVTILNYFHRMTNMLEPMLNSHPLPLYLAGVDYLIPIFKEATKYNHLREGHVSGAFKEGDMMTLHQKSWEIAEPHFMEERLKRKDNFQGKKVEGLAISNDNMKLIKAALTGGVDTLLVNKKHEHIWGSYNAEKHTIDSDNEQTKSNHCLVDEAAAKTIEFKGKVYMVEPENMPEDTIIAGTLRYPI